MIEEVAGGALRFIGRILFEVVYEFLIKGAGYLLCRAAGSRRVDPDGGAVIVVGVAFWFAVGVGIFFVERQW
jgi:hypothetical protein